MSQTRPLRPLRLRPQRRSLPDGCRVHARALRRGRRGALGRVGPAESINPAVREALLEEGIDISAETPKILTTEAVEASDVVITMGCGDTCPFFPGKRYLDWVLEDPAGQGSRRSARSATRSADASASCSTTWASGPPGRCTDCVSARAVNPWSAVGARPRQSNRTVTGRP